MPELPEVETVRKDLNRLLSGKQIATVRIRLNKIVKTPSAKFQRLLAGQSIVSVRRRAKLLLIRLLNNYTLIIHLKMSGQLVFVTRLGRTQTGGHPIAGGTESLPNKYTHVIIGFIDGSYLYYNDLRQFGYWLLWPSEKIQCFFANKKLGLEPLVKSFVYEKFRSAIKRKRKSAIKPALLDQSVVAGLGNIYADEVLFMSKIRPTRRVNQLTEEETKRIFFSINKVLNKAIEKRGTTMRNYRDGRGRPGGMLKHLKVYGREGEACRRCGEKISRIRQAGRSSHYCPKCQR